MSYKVLLSCMLVLSLAALGQTGAGNQTSSTQSPNQPVALGNNLGSNGGTVGYYGEGPAGGVLLTTPTATFDSPAPTAGISDAGRAGISNSSPVNTAVQSGLGSSTLVYGNIQPEIAGTSPATAAVSPERPISDLGPSFFSNEVGATIDGNNQSLGEVAEFYRNLQPKQNVRTYTNADIRPAGTITRDENGVLAVNMPPAMPQSGSASHRTSDASPTTPVQTAQNTEPAGAPNGTQNERLPASATILPLLGLMGLMSTGIGILLRGFSQRRTS